MGLLVFIGIVFLVVEALQPAPLTIPPSEVYVVAGAPDITSIDTRGTVKASSEVSLSFQGQGGTLQTVDAHVGSHVKKGQVLATVSDSSEQAEVAQANAGVQEAEGQLAEAKAHLNLVLAGPTAQTDAAAQAQVAAAKTALKTAMETYQEQELAYHDRTAQEAGVVSAENAVSQAKTALATAEQNQTAQQRSAESAVTSAENQLQIAEQNVSTYQSEYGNITLAQVKQANSTYLNELSLYNQYQNDGFAPPNPYASALQADEQNYQTLNTDYYTLQNAEQTEKSAEQAVEAAKAQETNVGLSVSQAQTAYQAAERALQQAQAEYNDRTAAKQALIASKTAVQNAQAAVKTAEGNAAEETQPSTPAETQDAQAAVQTAEAGVAAAEAQVQSAEVQESFTKLVAPTSGIITQAPMKVGDFAGSGTAVFTLDVTRLHVEIAVSETQVHLLQNGDKIRYQVPEWPGQTFHGTIFQIYPTPIPGNGGEYKVLATVNDVHSELRPGMTGNVTIALGNQAKSLQVPFVAVHRLDGVTGVYAIVSSKQSLPSGDVLSSVSSAHDGQYVRLNNSAIPSNVYFVPVSLGEEGGTYAQVMSGLVPGEKVLIGDGVFFMNHHPQG